MEHFVAFLGKWNRIEFWLSGLTWTKLRFWSNNNQNKLCHETSNSFQGSSVQTWDVMSKTNAGWYLRDSFRRSKGQANFDLVFAIEHNARETKAWNGRNISLVWMLVWCLILQFEQKRNNHGLWTLLYTVFLSKNLSYESFFKGCVNTNINPISK